ncbi:ABC transporter substrate-binding protein [Gordonia sp. (in: high G+C Gram-positive bacteria)]|uniref:ABC transporter substrate-binding protein n=1 Tax=Gordonia sp. (in: high G+C Gram-positive bacteria) TaxID=84139 RepID=UPI003F9635B8
MTRFTPPTSVRWWALIGMLIIALGVGACSSSNDDGDEAAAITVTHAKGTIALPAAPERIVAVGSGDVQIASALGADVVGAVANPSAPDKNWPGTPKPFPESVMSLDSTAPNIEAIAALHPDVILATTAQQAYIDKYPELSRIAPTVVYKTEAFADSGDTLVELIGTALGKPDQARDLISSSKQAISEFTEANPTVKGMTYAFGQYAGDQLYLLASEKNPSTRFLTSLGMRLDPKVAELGKDGTQDGFTELSAENYTQISSAQKVLVSTPGDEGGAKFSANPTVKSAFGSQLEVISTDLAGALLTANPASTDYLLEQLRPALA